MIITKSYKEVKPMKKKVVLSVAVVLLIVMVAVMCVACTPNSDNLKKKLEKKDYVVKVSTSKAETSMFGDDAEKVLMAGKKGSLSPDLTVIWFKDSKSADKAYKDAQNTLEKLGDAGKDMKVVKKGKAVVSGKKDAVKLV